MSLGLAALSILLASRGAAPLPVPLTSIAQLRTLCSRLPTNRVSRHPGTPAETFDSATEASHLEAQQTELVVHLPSGEFHVSQVDARTGSLTIDTQRAFRPFGVHAVLDSVEQGDLELTLVEGHPLPANPEALALELVVRPGDEVEPQCTVAPNGDVTLGIEIVKAALVDSGGRPVAMLESDEENDRPAAPGGKPGVDIDPAQVEGSSGMSDALTTTLVALRPKLLGCFEHALQKIPELDGVLVLGFELGPDGHPGHITLVADSVQDDEMADCVVELVKGVAVSRSSESKGKKAKASGADESHHRVSVTLRFERK